MDFGSLCFLHGYCLFILFFLQPSAFWFWPTGTAALSLVAAAPELQVQDKACADGAAGLCPWLGFCCCSCECLPQPFPRAVLLGFYLPYHSPGWALAMPGRRRKAVYAAHEGWLCTALPFFFSVATSLAGTRSAKQSNQMKCISAEEMQQFTV